MKFISIENEIMVWKMVITLCKGNMAAYDTSYEEDMKLLEEDEKEEKLT